MRTIHKYELNATETPQKISLPEGSVALHVEVINHVIYLWVDQTDDIDAIHDDHTFTIYGTGHLFEHPGVCESEHVGTVFQGPFVWHVYHSWAR